MTTTKRERLIEILTDFWPVNGDDSLFGCVDVLDREFFPKARPSAPAGLTRAQAIEVLDRTVPPYLDARVVTGARTLLRALIEAGAFSDGRNWADRVPIQPGERAWPPTDPDGEERGR